MGTTDIDISIVTGTYNRLKYLTLMVRSIRQSIAPGINYEIIVVDGGSSKDATIEWCKEQPDIVLVEHGCLKGCIYSFNDGFSRAKGRYVLIANDDIEFIYDSITHGLSFMEDHPDVGCGCFWQDRYGKDFHVEYMPAVDEKGQQVSVPYGQVCLVPKWLGDKVGWWSNEYKDYGGDTHMSCKIWELGFKVVGMPNSCIHDFVAQDELRVINRGDVSLHQGRHPDSIHWQELWTKDGVTGPRIGSKAEKEGTLLQRKPRILYAPIYEKYYAEFQKKTKRGLREALKRKGYTVGEVDYISDPLELFPVADALQPDIFLMQLQDTDIIRADRIRRLKAEHPKALFINWNGDYHPEHLYNPSYMELMRQFHLCAFVTTVIGHDYVKAGIPWAYWQIGFEEANNTPDPTTPKHDIVFLANGYSPERIDLGHRLQEFNQYDVGIYGYWPRPTGVKALPSNLYDYDAGAKLYANAKIVISDSIQGANGFVSNRLFQALSAGGFVLQKYFSGMTGLLGLKDGEHLIVWEDLDELEKLIDDLITPSTENFRRKIAKAGQKYVREHHSFDNRVAELEIFIDDLRNGRFNRDSSVLSQSRIPGMVAPVP